MPVFEFLGFGQTQRACPLTHVLRKSRAEMVTTKATEDFMMLDEEVEDEEDEDEEEEVKGTEEVED